MTITWSGSADFSGSPSAGAYQIDSLTIPSGNAPGSASHLYIAMACTVTPGTAEGADVVSPYFVDAGSGEYQFTPVAGYIPGTAIPLVPGKGYFYPDSGTAVGSYLSPTLLDGGGFIRFKGGLTAAEVIVGTVVAAIWDGSGTNRALSHASGTSGTPLTSPRTANVSSLSSPTILRLNVTNAIGGVADSGPASTPDMAGSANWANVVRRTNGDLFAGIGQWTGTIPFSNQPYTITFSDGTAGFSVTRLEVDLVSAGTRNFVGIIG